MSKSDTGPVTKRICDKKGNTYTIFIEYVTTVVVFIDLSGKEPHWHVGVGSMVTPGSLGGDVVSTLVQNARYVGLIPALGTVFPIWIPPMTLVDMTTILYKLHDV